MASKKSFRPDPDTLSSSLGIRPSDVRAAVARVTEAQLKELRSEWIIVWPSEGRLYTERFNTRNAVDEWLQKWGRHIDSVIIGPVPVGTIAEERAT